MNIEEIKDRVNKTKNAFYKLGTECQVNINLMLNDIEFLLTAYEKEKEIVDKINKLNIPVDTLIAEFERLENLEDDRDILKKEIEELKDKFEKIYIEIDNKNNELVKALDYKIFIEDKIKAKIEEYENKIKKIRSKKIINEPEDTIIITRYAHYISALHSLLEKE